MNTPSHYRPDIDGLRAVAVLAVVLHHLSAELLPGGYVGVDVFFVISGYLITRIISREMQEGTFTFARFYERRARRIFPALFAVLAATLVASYFLLLPSDMASTLRGALGTVFFGSNLVFWREMKEGYFAATDLALNPLLHTWSLAVEEQFYLLFPVLLLFCYRYARQHLVAVLVACAIVSLAGAALLVQSKSVAVFFLSPFRAWELLVGSLLALQAVQPLRSRLLRELVAGVGLFVILAACIVYDSKTTFPGLAALVPVLGTAALIHAGTSGPSFASRLLQLRPMVWIGLISYSLYLWHWPLIVLARYALGFEPITQYMPALLIASVLLAYLSYRFIEQPFRRGLIFSRCAAFRTSATCAAVLTTVAGVGLYSGGFETRFEPEVLALDKARAPIIPYRQCLASTKQWCALGHTDSIPNTLLWGDSHMQSWMPALDKVLREAGKGAVFAGMSSCPPMLGILRHTDRKDCAAHNVAIQSYIAAHPEITTIVMAGFWSHYFRSDGPLSVTRNGEKLYGVNAAQAGLQNTLIWLHESGRRIVLIGPVPVYQKSVPLALALGLANQQKLIHSTAQDQLTYHAQFFQSISTVGTQLDLTLLNPIEWMCTDECVTSHNDKSLYRDAHHLSVEGALFFAPMLKQGFPSATQ